MNRDVFGKKGDFITSPEISQVFGEVSMVMWVENVVGIIVLLGILINTEIATQIDKYIYSVEVCCFKINKF